MTMTDMKCDVCGIGEAIGVASTSIPYSCAYCVKCCQMHADPILVFHVWREEGIKPDDMHSPDLLNTFKDGKYISYREWYNAYEGQTSGSTESDQSAGDGEQSK